MKTGKFFNMSKKSSTAFRQLTLFLLLCSGCNRTSDTDETGDTSVPPPPNCEPALSFSPDTLFVEPFDFLTLRAYGGTGNYLFSLESDENGAEVQSETGVFAAGPTADVTETVSVSDEECQGSASATVHVVEPLTVTPETISLPVNTPFIWSVSGGSGEVEVTHFQNQSGSTLGDAGGTTGSATGHDIIQINDLHTGQTATIRLYVEESVSFQSHGRHFVLPLGASYTPSVLNGSGSFELTLLSGNIEINEQTFEANETGLSRVQITDRYVPSFNTKVFVSVTRPLGYNNGEPGGPQRLQNAAKGAGDLNGDGYPDAILGLQELHIDAYSTGGVLIYAGGPSGLSTEPEQILSPSKINSRFGHTLALEDFNGDGEIDLAVGAPYASGTGVQTGAVYVYAGLDGGFFEDEPFQVLNGTYSYDRTGYAIATCDLNNDGLPDLLSTAWYAEDRSALSRANTQGGVFVYFGRETGLPDKPDHTVWGSTWDGTAWIGQPDLRLGLTLTVGDFNGDEQCDYAVGAISWAHDGSGNDGVAFVYSGLDSFPFFHTVYEHPTASGEYGRSLATADFDGDGIDELIVGSAKGSNSITSAGSAHVFWVSERLGETGPVLATDADWLMYGDSANSYFGRTLETGDANGDGVPDLIINATQDELAGEASAAGVTLIIDGAELASRALSEPTPYDATLDPPWMLYAGENTLDRFGQSFTPVGDVNDDGTIDFLAYAATDSTFGALIGAPYYIDGLSTERALLSMPVVASGANIGAHVAMFDQDNDGNEDAFISAQYASDPEFSSQAGYASSHTFTSTDWDDTEVTLWRVEIERAFARYATDLYPIGDFNNDGFEDMAFLSRGHRTNDTTVNTQPSGCENLGYGGVYIHLGSASGLSPTPAFRLHAPTGLNYLDRVVGRFDFNGDGYQDIAISNRTWSSYNGGLKIVLGRGYDPSDGLTGLCNGILLEGIEGSEDLGYSMAPLGDIDGDGFDELAVAAKDQNMGLTRQGVVWVLWGKSDPTTSLELTPLGGGKTYTYLGSSLAGGQDIDGDEYPDAIVGAYSYGVGGNSMGGIWLIPGAYLKDLPRTTVTNGLLPITAEIFPVAPSKELSYGLFGDQTGGQFGYAVALVPSPNTGEAHWVAVGSRYGTTDEEEVGGMAQVFRWIPNEGFDDNPQVIVTTEDYGYGAALGSSLAGGIQSPFLLVGSPFSNALGTAQGAAYAVELQPESGL